MVHHKTINIRIEEHLADIQESSLEWNKNLDGQTLRISKSILERYSSSIYHIDGILEFFSKSLFELDPIEKIILESIAKNGRLNEKEIVEFAWAKNKDHTRDKIRYRLCPKNSETLLSLGFLTQETGGKIGNFKNKQMHYYVLTFKGLMASLAVCKFEDNYLVKHFKKLISKCVSEYNVPEFTVNFMKYHLALFMLKNVLEGSRLTGSKNIEVNLFTMNQSDPLLSVFYPQKIENSELWKMAEDVRSGFHLYSQVLKKALEKVIDEGWKRKKTSGKEIQVLRLPEVTNACMNVVPSFIKNWYDRITKLQYIDIQQSHLDAFLYEEEQEMINPIELTVDNFAVNLLARRILKSFGIHPNFSLVEASEFIL